MFNFFKTQQVAPSVQKWEYLVMPLVGEESVDLLDHKIMLNGVGQAGWELVNIYKDYMVFKKPC